MYLEVGNDFQNICVDLFEFIYRYSYLQNGLGELMKTTYNIDKLFA